MRIRSTLSVLTAAAVTAAVLGAASAAPVPVPAASPAVSAEQVHEVVQGPGGQLYDHSDHSDHSGSESGSHVAHGAEEVSVGHAAQDGVLLPGPWHRKRARSAYLTSLPPTSDQYRFLYQPVAGYPVRWEPCGAVRWRFHPRHAPVGGLEVVQRAVARVSAATGLPTVYDGTTATVPSAAYTRSQSGVAPLIIGWSTSAESDLLAGKPSSTAGVAITRWSGASATTMRIHVGAIALNKATSAPLTGPGSWHMVTLHELGHAFGLNHVTSSVQVMNPAIPRSLTDLGDGDRSGLYRLGRAGCTR